MRELNHGRFRKDPPSTTIKKQDSQNLIDEFLKNGGEIKRYGVTKNREIVVANGKVVNNNFNERFTDSRFVEDGITFINRRVVCELTGYCTTSIFNKIKSGLFPVAKKGGGKSKHYWDENEIIEYVKKHGVNTLKGGRQDDK